MPSFNEIFEQSYSGQWSEFTKLSEKIQNIINYAFNNKEYLWSAMSIRGSKLPTEKFERLEFLGDAILKAVHGILLFDKSEEFSPGDLTSLRRNFEENDYHALLAYELQVDKISALLGIGKLSTNQAADCYEALMGAIFLDNGRNLEKMIQIVKGIIHFEKKVKEALKFPWGSKDPKSFLNEWVQKNYGTDVIIDFPPRNEGPQNAPAFYIKAVIKRKDNNKIEIEGPSVGPFPKKKDGEKEAAMKILEKLREEGKIEN